MKSIAFTWLIILLYPFVGEAQTQKGQWTVGAQIGNLSYQNGSQVRLVSISLAPSAGYFITNGLVIGTGIPISISRQRTTNFFEYNANLTAVGLSPFVRYYVGEKKIKPYLGLAYSYSKTASKRTSNEYRSAYESEGKGKTTAFVPTIGLAYFLNQNLGLTLGLNYSINHEDQAGTTTYVGGAQPSAFTSEQETKSFSLAIGFQLFISK